MEPSQRSLLQSVRSLLLLHGGRLACSLVGDELRRRDHEAYLELKRSKLVLLVQEHGEPYGLTAISQSTARKDRGWELRVKEVGEAGEGQASFSALSHFSHVTPVM